MLVDFGFTPEALINNTSLAGVNPAGLVTAIKDMDIDYVIPLHCTGEPLYEMAKAEIPNKLLRSYTGTRFVFST